MNYVSGLAERIAKQVALDNDTDDIHIHPDYNPLYDLYALLCLTKGTNTTNQDVHDAWSIWQNKINPKHHSLRPFSELTPEVQALDTPYRNAIRTVAKERR